MLNFTKISNSVKIIVSTTFNEQSSKISEYCFVWDLLILIENLRPESIKLVGVRWESVETNGFVRKFASDGILAEKPVIKKNGVFRYVRTIQMSSPSSMLLFGEYIAISKGEEVRIELPSVYLDCPKIKTYIN